MNYTIQFYTNPYTYPDYGTITSVGGTFEVTGVDIDDNMGVLRTDRLTYEQRFTVNYLKITRDEVVLYADITNMVRVSGNNLIDIHFKVDAFRSFKSDVVFGEQFVVRQPASTYDLDPMLRGESGTVNDITTTKKYLSDIGERILVVQIMRPDGNTSAYTTPLQPSPYLLFFADYSTGAEAYSDDIIDLIQILTNSARPSNLVSIHSVPRFEKPAGMIKVTMSLPLIIDGVTTAVGDSFYTFSGGHWDDVVINLSDELVVSQDILRTRHAVSLVIPEAGVINIPDDVLFKDGLKLRQDIDLYSGASNFMLVWDGAEASGHSARGGGISPVPIAYDAQQQMLAVNKSNLATGIMGDVASIGIGIAGLAGAGFTGGASAYVGGGMIAKGVMGIIGTMGGIGDSVNQQVNPPSFLGSAMTLNFNQIFFLVVTKARDDNATVVHDRYGYQTNQVQTVTIPSSGYLQLQDANVAGSIPNWAKTEINTLLNNGLRVK